MSTGFDWFGWDYTIVRVDMVAAFKVADRSVVAVGPTGERIAIWECCDEETARVAFGSLQAELRKIAERRGETKVDDNDRT